MIVDKNLDLEAQEIQYTGDEKVLRNFFGLLIGQDLGFAIRTHEKPACSKRCILIFKVVYNNRLQETIYIRCGYLSPSEKLLFLDLTMRLLAVGHAFLSAKFSMISLAQTQLSDRSRRCGIMRTYNIKYLESSRACNAHPVFVLACKQTSLHHCERCPIPL